MPEAFYSLSLKKIDAGTRVPAFYHLRCFMYKTYVLPNGLRIICEYIGYVRSVSVGVFVKNGSRHEPQELSGISHFIEHMLFKGTEKRSALDIAEEVDTVGGALNAYTTKEYTCFYAKMLDENLDTALDVLSDMLLHPKLSDGDIALEKNVVYEEIAMYEDSPEDMVHELIMEAAWGVESGLGASTLGTKETLSKIDSRVLRDYMAKTYTPKNCVIAVAGNFSDDIEQRIATYFGTWGGSGAVVDDFQEEYHANRIIRQKEIEQVHFCLGFPAYPSEDDRNYPALAFNNIFGAGMSSSLFQKVREQRGLVYSIFSYMASYLDTGMFVISASMKPENLSEVLRLVYAEIDAAKRTPLDEKAMYKAKQQLKGNYILGLENVSARMQSIGRAKLLLDKVRTPEEILQRIEKINPENTFAIVGDIFDYGQMCVSAIGNLDGAELNLLQNPMKK